MNQIAILLDNTAVYWYSIILTMAVLTGGCCFMACCLRARIPGDRAALTLLLSLVLSLIAARLLYWNCRADSFSGLGQAFTTPGTGNLALAGAFLGCGVSALLMGKFSGGLLRLLDCMSVAGCGTIALGRLGNFFTSSDRGQIVTEMIDLPWAYPVLNSASGLPDYRLATFLFQAAAAGILFLFLASLFFSRRWKRQTGDITLLFLLVYGASQVILDSTRYDSLYLQSNGFVSMVQILAAVALAAAVIRFAVKAVKAVGLKKWMPPVWLLLAGLFGLAGFMEYYVQRHGKRAFFSYSVMEHCLVVIIVLSVLFWRISLRKAADAQGSQKD